MLHQLFSGVVFRHTSHMPVCSIVLSGRPGSFSVTLLINETSYAPTIISINVVVSSFDSTAFGTGTSKILAPEFISDTLKIFFKGTDLH